MCSSRGTLGRCDEPEDPPGGAVARDAVGESAVPTDTVANEGGTGPRPTDGRATRGSGRPGGGRRVARGSGGAREDSEIFRTRPGCSQPRSAARERKSAGLRTPSKWRWRQAIPEAIVSEALWRQTCKRPKSEARPFSKAQIEERLSPHERRIRPCLEGSCTARRSPSISARAS